MIRVWRLGHGIVLRFIAHDGMALAGHIAFSTLLSVFPFVIVAVMTASLIVGQEGSVGAVRALVELLPPELEATLEPVLMEVIAVNRGSVLTLSAAVAFWSASTGVEAFRTAFDRAYEVSDPRPWWQNRLQSLGLVLAGTGTLLIVSIAILGGPLLIGMAEGALGIRIPGIVDALRYAIGVLVFCFFLLTLHRLLPPRPPARLWPGVLATALLFTAMASAFSIWLAHAPGYAVTYGAMAGVVVMMLFFYLTGAVIILGAEINAALARG